MSKKYTSKTLAYPWSQMEMDTLLNDGYLVLNCTNEYCLLVKIENEKENDDGETLQKTE